MKLSFKIAFSGIMAALAAVMMLIAGFIPVLTYVSPLAASIFLIPVMTEINKKWGWMTWCAVSILSLILCADKEAAFFYIFAGYYPLIKEYPDRIKNRFIRVSAKLLMFAAAIGVMYALLIYVLALPAVIADFKGAGMAMNIIMFAVMVFIMLCFDRVDGFAVFYYTYKIKPKLKKIFRNQG